MHRNKKKRNIIIFSLVGVLLCMVAGYAAFQTRLEIKGTSKVTSNWNILITNVTAGTPTGSAENAVAPKWDKLTASMEANLYDKGDAMEYDVTIENQGTIDAKLNDVLANLENSNSEAVLITFSGYAKGEILKAKSTKIIHVKIEYNPEYDGGETSSEVEIDFDYGQNNNEENNPDDQYLLTYDYSTNGGQSVELDKEYMLSGSNVNLDNTATKEGWTFVGWNTDKDAQIGLKEYQMPTSNTILYAIYSKDLKVTYEKEDTVESIGKNEDACTIYNNETSCEVTLPEINVKDESATIGWYENNNKVGNPGDEYTLKNNITLKAKAEFEPIIQSWSNGASTDFHAEEYITNIITATFLDNKDVPDNAIASWDVSANDNGSVMAWVVADETDSSKYHLYIGGDGGVIANKTSSYLFYNFKSLQKITFGDNFDTSNVTDMSSMFEKCSSLTSLDVSNFDTSNVTNMQSMFSSCSSLTTLDVSKWDTGNVTNMGYLFAYCKKIDKLNVNNFDTSNVTNMQNMFSSCSSLTTLDVSNFDTSNVTNMQNMFYSCSSLTVLDVSKWDTSNVTDMSWMFRNCSSLTTLDVSNWDTSDVTNADSMFYGCSSLTTLDVSKWDTSNVTNMQSMFHGCSSLTVLDVSKWDTGNVTNMGYLFAYCEKIDKLNVSNFNTSKVTKMYGMFEYCSNLKSIDLSNFDTSKVTSTIWMFEGCSSLTTLDLSNFDTSNVTNMSFMFSGCKNLIQLNVSGFDTSKVTEMERIFWNCSSLTKLALCSFNTSNVTNMEYMFYGTTNLKSIYVGPNWTTENATTTGMFTNSGVSTVTQSNNCEVDAEDISLSISTTSTTNSITVVANATADSGIAKYEYSKDGGKTWETGTNNTYTFTGLKNGTSYNIAVRVTSNIGKTLTKQTVEYVNITDNIVTSGDGLYEDEYEEGRYVYRGSNPDNYIWFNDELWRIVAKEADGTYKIIRNDILAQRSFDEKNHRSTANNSYCLQAQWGCGVFAAVEGTFSSPSGSQSGTVTEDSSIKLYLNDDYYVNNINATAKGQMTSHSFNIGVVEYLYKSGAENDSIEKNIAGEKMYTWKGNVGLVNVSDILRASTNPLCTSATTSDYNDSDECNSNYLLDKGSASYVFYWTINAYSDDSTNYHTLDAWYGFADSQTMQVSGNSAFTSVGTRPVIFLKSNITLTGEGTKSNPYKINQGLYTSTLEKPTFSEEETTKTVTITYPEGCGDNLTCTYQKDNGNTVNVTSTTVDVEFTVNGSLVATVSDGTNTVSSTYNFELANNTNINYAAHVSDIGWQDYVSGGQMAGTTGQQKPMEAIKIKLVNLKKVSGGVSYNAHVSDKGWLGYVSDDAIGGTTGQSLKMEAIQIQLTGDIANYYDIYYRAHVESFGWMDWAKNGQSAGTKGYSYSMHAIEIRLVAKGEEAPGPTTTPFREK